MSDFIISAGDICDPYDVIDVGLSAYSSEGNFDYQKTLANLVEYAKQEGADGVIHVQFNERSAVGSKKVCFQDQTITIFEVRAWGTMIRLRS